MKKTAYYYLSLAAIVAGGLVSCQDENQGFTKEEISYAKFEKEYNENFERDYGKIAEGHTWGFDKPTLTRASSGESNQYKVNRSRHETINGYYTDKATGEHVTGTGGSFDMEDIKYININCPPVITDAERAYVFQYLNDHPDEGDTKCELSNYFLQNLGQNPHTFMAYGYNNGHREDVATRTESNSQMDQLCFDGTHFKDYNSSGYGIDYYVTNTSIINPTYENSASTNQHTIENHYRFYYIPSDPENNFEGGCYLCFDYYLDSQNAYYPGDGVYDDWVIKIYPGDGDLWRVFCEDLGSTIDLDFNDLVFDYCDYGNGRTSIKVLALEGTLPIFIDGIDLKGEDLEAHHTVDMPVFFINKKVEGTNNLISVKRNPEDEDDKGYGTCFIANGDNRAPYLLRVKPGVEWPDENQRIEHKYPSFTEYVSQPTARPDWWGDFTNNPDITPNDSQYHNN